MRAPVADALEGLALLWSDRSLRPMAASLACRDLSRGLVGAVILLFVARDLGFGPGAMGAIFAVGGVSSLVGATATAAVTARLGPGLSMIAGLVGALFGLALLAAAGGGAALAAALLVASQIVGDGAMTVYEVNQESTRQAIVPERLLGRVEAGIRVAGIVASLAGTALGGALGSALGLRLPLVVGVAALVLAIAALWPVRGLGAADVRYRRAVVSDIPEADAQEQRQSVTGDEPDSSSASEFPADADQADVLEQREDTRHVGRPPSSRSAEVPEADAYEQQLEVDDADDEDA